MLSPTSSQQQQEWILRQSKSYLVSNHICFKFSKRFSLIKLSKLVKLYRKVNVDKNNKKNWGLEIILIMQMQIITML